MGPGPGRHRALGGRRRLRLTGTVERLAIVGYPNAGKTSLFNALTGLEATVASFPYTTTAPNTGVARLRDPSLEAAAACEGSAKVVPAAIEIVDLPAADSGSSGFGAEYLGRLREMDALCVVLRAFAEESVPAPHGEDPVSQAEELGLEFALADAAILGRMAVAAAKEAAADRTAAAAAAAFEEAARMAEDGRPLRTASWPDSARVFQDMGPLTLKPVVWVVNASEDARGGDDLVQGVQAVVPAIDRVAVVSARLEAEAARLDSPDREELLAAFGLGAGARNLLVGEMYAALDLITFYTINPKEAHAWTVTRGTTVREAAGKVHSDMERGFVRAEVGSIEDVVAAGGWSAARAAGATRVEAKEYEVQDSDVVHVRFSV